MIPVNGKGGVGKTSMSCAMAIWMASRGFRTVLLSTDPAASLGDCLNRPIGNELRQVEGIPNLWALEINGAHEYAKFYEYLKAHTTMDKYMSPTGAPGMNEMAALYKVITYVYDLRFDVVIVDTAPTGHTLEMLKMPEMLSETMGGVKTMLSSINAWKQLLTGDKAGKANKKIDVLVGVLGKIEQILKDKDITHFNLVTIAEYMSLREEVRAYNELVQQGIQVKNIIMNKLQPENKDCSYCSSRHQLHTYYVDRVKTLFPDIPIIKIKAYATEVVDKEKLLEIGKELIQQMDNLDIRTSMADVRPQNGGFIISTQLPFIGADNLSFNAAGNRLEMIISFGLHEEIRNVITLPRPISIIKPIDDKGKLMLYVQ